VEEGLPSRHCISFKDTQAFQELQLLQEEKHQGFRFYKKEAQTAEMMTQFMLKNLR